MRCGIYADGCIPNITAHVRGYVSNKTIELTPAVAHVIPRVDYT